MIERICGSFGNPEELAQMRSGEPRQPLYRVRFLQKQVWPGYQGSDDGRGRSRDFPALARMSDNGTYQPYSYFQLMEVSLRELLVEKGIVTEAQVAATVEDMRERTPERGARVVARAWIGCFFPGKTP